MQGEGRSRDHLSPAEIAQISRTVRRAPEQVDRFVQQMQSPRMEKVFLAAALLQRARQRERSPRVTIDAPVK